MKSGRLADPVLVGRERELVELQQSLDLAIRGKGTTVFVSGEAGAGKTRLTHEFLENAKKKGINVAAGWCISNSAIPYFPFLEAFNSYFSSGDEEEYLNLQQPGGPGGFTAFGQTGNEVHGINEWLIGSSQVQKPGKLEVLSPQIWKDQTFAAVAKTLHGISSREPLILFIEDLHWADSASLALLHYIARAIISERILVLATFRSEELTVDVEGHPHPLSEEMRIMRREELFTEIKLANLNQSEISKVTSNMVGGSLSPEFVERLSKESRGNALFVVESLRMLFERRSLVEENGYWHLTVDELGIPSKIKDIILRRLAILKFNQRRVLDAASIIGEKFDVELLSSVLGQDTLDVLETINIIAQSTSLVCVEDNFYRFDHAKSRETLYAEIPLPLKKGYHARIAERLEGINNNGRLQLGELAYHYTQAGNKEKATKYSLAAGQEALARWSNTEAINHFTFVLQAIGEGSEYDDERIKALEGLGDAYYSNSMYKDAIRTFELLAKIARGVVKLRAFRKAMDVAFFQTDISHLAELVEEAEKYSALDRLENARIQVNRSRVNFMRRQRGPNPIEKIEERLQVFEEEYSLWDTALGQLELGNVSSMVGKPVKGIAAYLQSIALFDELGDLRWQGRLRIRFGMAYSIIPEAFDSFSKAVEIFEKIGEYGMLAEAYASWALGFEVRGNLEEAVSRSLKALEYSKKTDSTWGAGLAYSSLTRLYTRLEDRERAEEYFQKLMNLPEQARHPATQFFLSSAVFLAGKNMWTESGKNFQKYFENAGKSPWALAYYAWALEKQGKNEEANESRMEAKKIYGGLQNILEHVNIQANLMIPVKTRVGQAFDARVDLVNVSTSRAQLVRVEDLIPKEFKVVFSSPEQVLSENSVEWKEKKLEPLQVTSLRLKLDAGKAGTFNLSPQVVIIDDLGETKIIKLITKHIIVYPGAGEEHVDGKISTGLADLNRLLLGGIPEGYAVVLAAPSIDERQMIINRFLEAGTKNNQTTFYVTTEPANTKALAEENSSNFYLFVCNPRADLIVKNLPYIWKLKGVENLTEIDIALAKAFRTFDSSQISSKRICIDIISDVLLQHHAVIARKWLSSLLPELKARGFTILAVINPQMHPQEELQAVLSLFEGEIVISEKESTTGTQRILKIKKMRNQKYLEDELIISSERFEQ